MYDVVIIDSGVKRRCDEKLHGFGIKKYKNSFSIVDEIDDDNGHGTIIYRIIKKHLPLSKVLIIKLFHENRAVDEDDLIFALSYIKNNIQCKVINISLGMKICNNIKMLRNKCQEIVESGTVIVSAFDNDNCFSFPACFDEVIGVDNNDRIKNIFDYEFVEASPINVRAKGGIQRIQLENGKTAIASGSSIACAFITIVLAQACKDEKLGIAKALNFLKDNSIYIYSSKNHTNSKENRSKFFNIFRAAVFPISKEMKAFIRFNELLSFKVIHYYDIMYSGKVGTKVTKFYENADERIKVEDINKSAFDDIDTLILGHLDELNKVCEYDIREKIIQEAIRHGINIYSFDPLEHYQSMIDKSEIKYFYPYVCEADVPQNTFGKLYHISKPVVGIFGTSSQQGKFSLQLTLKHIFELNDYQVGSIGTEPQSLLFNMDVVYPMGYNATLYINPWQSIIYLNYQMQKLCEKDVDIIITSSQAGSASHDFNNLMDYPIKQSVFLMGVHPDALILCINIYDEISYIKNTIQVLQGHSDARVIAFVMYPLTVSTKTLFQTKEIITYEEFEIRARLLKMEFGIPIYLLGKSEHMYRLYQDIVDFF